MKTRPDVGGFFEMTLTWNKMVRTVRRSHHLGILAVGFVFVGLRTSETTS